jgi:hypothetical protein
LSRFSSFKKCFQEGEEDEDAGDKAATEDGDVASNEASSNNTATDSANQVPILLTVTNIGLQVQICNYKYL